MKHSVRYVEIESNKITPRSIFVLRGMEIRVYPYKSRYLGMFVKSNIAGMWEWDKDTLAFTRKYKDL